MVSNTDPRVVPVILAGGTGSRLWPLSREQYPKQFLKLDGAASLLQNTLQRLQGLPLDRPWVVCNEAHRFLAAEQLREIGALQHNVLLEPVGRNTAPAVALAALKAVEAGDDPVLLVLAADHWIADAAGFRKAVWTGLPLAQDGHLVTFGIQPTGPETGYGYIRVGADLAGGGHQVAGFTEKPSLATAQRYLEQGGYLWNAGLFLFRARQYLRELQTHRPDIAQACQNALSLGQPDLDFVRVDAAAFAQCPSDSIDYAVMEHTARAAVVPMDVGWNDIGAFASLWQVLPKDDGGNVHRGDVLAHASQGNLVIAESALVATVGVENMVVLQTKDAVLVAPKSRAQDVKAIVERLKAAGRSEHNVHRQVYRPWGHYDSVDVGTRHQVKRITVLPGARISVQKHHHRSEHWVVVSGTAKVTLQGQEHLLTENESIYIPIGAVHTLENPGKIPLEVVEVQVGSYLGEDDIVRFDDRYGRVAPSDPS